MFTRFAVAVVLGAACLTTACNGASPTAPSVKDAKADNHVEPPGVLTTPNGGARSTPGDHVEPPGVLYRDGGGIRRQAPGASVEAR